MGGRLYLVVAGVHHIEEETAVGEIEGGTAKFLVERRVVEQKEIFKKEQPRRLKAWRHRHEFAELVEGLFVELFGMVNQVGDVHADGRCRGVVIWRKVTSRQRWR